MMHDDTIAAIATPVGTGGISIVKASGACAVAAVAGVFKPQNAKRSLERVPTQTMVYGHIVDPQRHVVIDEVLVTVLKGPHSYTGEDVVEINCHGGQQVSRAILEVLLSSGLRLAQPGEFTRRAFLNGRIDLTQAESIIDLIHAKTRRAARVGSRALAGGLGRCVGELRQKIAEIRARVEASIDFCDEDDTELEAETLLRAVREDILPSLRRIVEGYRDGRLIRHGLRIVLTGKPNVGKSSLMNQLLRRDRVIVTEIPGTTRDTVEEGFEIDGIPILLSDTAGMREAADPVEAIGQEKTREAIDQADLVLLMVDASQPTDEDDVAILASIGERPYLLVRNKVDLVSDGAALAGDELVSAEGSIALSALHGEGLDLLKDRIVRFAGIDASSDIGCPPNQRQQLLLSRALELLDAAVVSGHAGPELLAVDLKECERYFNQVLGIDVQEDVLDAIFSRFCIGK